MRQKNSFLLIALLFFLCFGFGYAFAAANLEEGVSQLANQISKSMQEKQKAKIAIIDFSDLNGNVTALGQFMAEELTTQLFTIAPGKFEVVERRMLLKLEEELVLGQTGFIEEKSIKKMGQVLGVDAIVTGSMTDLGNSVKINARLIAVDSAKVFAVAATDIPKTGMVADLIAKQVEGRQTTKPSTISKQETKTQQSEVVKGFLFEVQGCEVLGREVSCHLLITNKENDRNFWLYSKEDFLGGRTTYSRMFDNSGNEYVATGVQLANAQSPRSIGKTLISNIPTKASVKFENVSSQISGISLLEIACGINSKQDNLFDVKLRNIPLSR